jgi:outer membrane protein
MSACFYIQTKRFFMRQLFIVLLVCFATFFTTVGFAQQLKIGVVNVGLLLEQTPQAKAASKSLEKEFAPQQAQLTRLVQQMEKKQKNFQKNKLVMSESQLQFSQREIEVLNRDMQRKKNDIQELVNIKRNEKLVSLQNVVNQAIKEVGKQEKLDLILYEGIAYTNNRLDVTKKVLEHLKKKYRK